MSGRDVTPFYSVYYQDISAVENDIVAKLSMSANERLVSLGLQPRYSVFVRKDTPAYMCSITDTYGKTFSYDGNEFRFGYSSDHGFITEMRDVIPNRGYDDISGWKTMFPEDMYSLEIANRAAEYLSPFVEEYISEFGVPETLNSEFDSIVFETAKRNFDDRVNLERGIKSIRTELECNDNGPLFAAHNAYVASTGFGIPKDCKLEFKPMDECLLEDNISSEYIASSFWKNNFFIIESLDFIGFESEVRTYNSKDDSKPYSMKFEYVPNKGFLATTSTDVDIEFTADSDKGKAGLVELNYMFPSFDNELTCKSKFMTNSKMLEAAIIANGWDPTPGVDGPERFDYINYWVPTDGDWKYNLGLPSSSSSVFDSEIQADCVVDLSRTKSVQARVCANDARGFYIESKQPDGTYRRIDHDVIDLAPVADLMAPLAKAYVEAFGEFDDKFYSPVNDAVFSHPDVADAIAKTKTNTRSLGRLSELIDTKCEQESLRVSL